MGFFLCVTIGLISAGYFWFKMRNEQKKPQPFIVHLIDGVAVLVTIFGWIMAAGLVLAILSGRL
jgi:hypothetical protein